MSATIVLVHGGFVDGAGWKPVYEELQRDGFDVRVVQNATKSLADDSATTRQLIDGLEGPVVLVGHSYGGAVITEAGTHEKVAALVYVTAFAPDQGESVNTLIAGFPQDGPSLRSCRPSTGTFSWTARSSMRHLPVTCPPTRPGSWPTRRCRGASRPWAGT